MGKHSVAQLEQLSLKKALMIVQSDYSLSFDTSLRLYDEGLKKIHN